MTDAKPIYDGMPIEGVDKWERCHDMGDGNWFKASGTVYIHMMVVDGGEYIDAMRIEEAKQK